MPALSGHPVLESGIVLKEFERMDPRSTIIPSPGARHFLVGGDKGTECRVSRSARFAAELRNTDLQDLVGGDRTAEIVG